MGMSRCVRFVLSASAFLDSLKVPFYVQLGIAFAGCVLLGTAIALVLLEFAHLVSKVFSGGKSPAKKQKSSKKKKKAKKID